MPIGRLCAAASEPPSAVRTSKTVSSITSPLSPARRAVILNLSSRIAEICLLWLSNASCDAKLASKFCRPASFSRQFRAILRIDLRLFLFPDRRELVDERLRLLGELVGFAIFQRDEQLAIGDAVRVFARNQFHATREQPLHPADVRRRQKIRQTRIPLHRATRRR